ncbi:MaoC family dehydratase [Massilia sp. DJPM01]|uniref:MaoC family dehydratase n=1 Tax=Massilia sp. DJPM01 TaxID=3024404 RepID=UPI00259E795F|nr:MaoC family dehydratase [Massilia sp. DJPM01]MDM5180349.1 MaoC family dehydratase [Massilia sp. DJPM01]
MKKTTWYFEDFYVGQEIGLGSRTVSEEEIIAFATQFDPQPFHVDHDAAKASIFGSVIASGWHTCSMMMRMVVDGLWCASSSMGSPGLDKVRWPQPVRAGDTLTVTYITTALKPSNSRPDRGVVWSTWRAVNQHGEVACVIEGMGMLGRRPKENGDA